MRKYLCNTLTRAGNTLNYGDRNAVCREDSSGNQAGVEHLMVNISLGAPMLPLPSPTLGEWLGGGLSEHEMAR